MYSLLQLKKQVLLLSENCFGIEDVVLIANVILSFERQQKAQLKCTSH